MTSMYLSMYRRAEQALRRDKLLLILNSLVRDQISWQPNSVPIAGET